MKGASDPLVSVRSADRGTWWFVFCREVKDLWIGGKALYMMLVYSVLLGVLAYVFASNSELSLIPPKEMVFELTRISIAAAGFICLIIGADAISGERERSTLESLLLTPVSRRQIVVGKLLAAITPWPAAFAIGVPYCWFLSQGDEAFGMAVPWGAVLGTLMCAGLAGLGMLVSLRTNSNRTSMFVSLALYLLVLVPTQLPGSAQTGAMGRMLKRVSPLESTYHFLEKTLVNSRTVDEVASFLLAPGLFALLAVGLVWWLAGRDLGLEATVSSRRWPRLATPMVLAVILLSIGGRAWAQSGSPEISIDRSTAVVNAGDPVLFGTEIVNPGSSDTGPLIVAMNIINLDAEGDVVDPEDWSPERTQYLATVPAGGRIDLSWRVNAILAGDYMVYLVIIPEPGGLEETSNPVASPGLHLTVNEFTRLNPVGVLPLVIGVPAVVGLAVWLVLRRQRRAAAGDEA